MFRIGTQELLLVLALALLIFGPTKLPKLGKAMGQTIGNFRVGVKKAQVDMASEDQSGEEGE